MSKVIANHMINDLFRYWKDRSKPCPMPAEMFAALVWCKEHELITKEEYKNRLKEFFQENK